MTCFVLLHYFEVVGVYSTRENAERGKTDSHVATLVPEGWHIQEWMIDKFLDATLANELSNDI
jgi:hypothetical protein